MEDGDAMNRAQSNLIVVNGEPGNPQLRRLSNRVKPRQATFPDTWPSKVRCSHHAARCLGLPGLHLLRLCGGRDRPPFRFGTGRPNLFLDAADAARPQPFRQSLAQSVYPSTPARNKWSVALWSGGPRPIMLQVVPLGVSVSPWLVSFLGYINSHIIRA